MVVAGGTATPHGAVSSVWKTTTPERRTARKTSETTSIALTTFTKRDPASSHAAARATAGVAIKGDGGSAHCRRVGAP